MEPDYYYRYCQAIDICQRAEQEILRLRRELAIQKAKTLAAAYIATEAIEALEILGAHNQA